MHMSASDWSRKFDVNGYYVRIAPKETGATGSVLLQKGAI